MKVNMIKTQKNTSLKAIILNYIAKNSKEYIFVILIFIIGLFIGVMFVNNCSDEKEKIISTYISDFIQKFTDMEQINNSNLVIDSIKCNLFLTMIIWLAGTTIIGMPLVMGLISFRGFCLGYTVSSICFSLGMEKGLVFCMLTLFLQNIFFIPALLTLGVSSIKLYKSIITDRRKENIKVEIIRHTIISLMMSILLILSSFIENDISVRLLKIGIKFVKK